MAATIPFNGLTNFTTLMGETWRLTSSLAVTSTTSSILTSNWERADTRGYPASATPLGTGMSESSGVFTFPATGIYLVLLEGYFAYSNSTTSNYSGVSVHVTTNNSDYANTNRGYCGLTSNSAYESTHLSSIIDVTDTANVKIKIGYEIHASGTVGGNTNDNDTAVTFIRLGDT